MVQSEGLLLCHTRPMQVTLTPHAEELLRDALAQHPGQSPAQILEEPSAERVEPDGCQTREAEAYTGGV
jgi:hypothetical protein